MHVSHDAAPIPWVMQQLYPQSQGRLQVKQATVYVSFSLYFLWNSSFAID